MSIERFAGDSASEVRADGETRTPDPIITSSAARHRMPCRSRGFAVSGTAAARRLFVARTEHVDGNQKVSRLGARPAHLPIE